MDGFICRQNVDQKNASSSTAPEDATYVGIAYGITMATQSNNRYFRCRQSGSVVASLRDYAALAFNGWRTTGTNENPKTTE